jgi:hypothetical protein
MITAGIVLLFAALVVFVNDPYLRAWLISIFLAVTLLYVLSIPRYISLADGILEIHCVVELTRIAVEDIQSIRKITPSEIRPLLLLGSYGFFGYYGYFADLYRYETLKVYATEWQNLILIQDIYETRYLISCQNPEKLIKQIESY